MRANRMRLLIIGVALASLGRLLAAEELPGVPMPANTAVVLALVGEGVQIYEAKPESGAGYRWNLKAPEAELKTLSGEIAGKHSAGPSWSLNDGSEIAGSVPPLKSFRPPDGKNIPWLLIGVKSSNGAGMLKDIQFVLRVSTEGGLAPNEPPHQDGETVRVKYRAIYLFLRKT